GGAIAVPPAQKIQIGADGTLSIVPQGGDAQTLTEVDRIKLVNPDARQLRKEQDGLFRLAAGAVAEADATVRVESGAIERSNVNAVESMSEIITLARQFEMQVKMMKTFEENAAQSTRILQM
ncbi:MAG TPA: flagellar basal body rod C-terminal domain-containing protein, partial [Pseudomonadales bacterium]|nr:flagellar basal body rod C-terminal domain-containing protein [Pseudomonadales bacterium]